MGKYKKKKSKLILNWILVICLLLLVVCLLIFVVPQMLYKMNSNPDSEVIDQSTISEIQETETQAFVEDDVSVDEVQDILEFPVELDEGNIRIESLFQFTGVNPDSQKQEATDVASIDLTNASNQHLVEAVVTLILESGKELSFIISDVPAGTEAMAFSVNNASLLATDVCTSITADVVFGEVTNHKDVEVSVDGMMITVKNTSSEDINGIDVYYRDVFGDKYFGGKTYIYNVEYLSAGESITVVAEESLLGLIEVVRVAVNNKN